MKGKFATAVTATCLLAGATAAGTAVAQSPDYLDVSITDLLARESSNEVLMFVTVSRSADAGPSSAQPLSGLPAGAFGVTMSVDDGVPQTISDLTVQSYEAFTAESGQGSPRPLSLALLLDRSTSMAGAAITNARSSATKFIDSRPPSDAIALYSFGLEATRLEDFTTEHAPLKAHVAALQADQKSTVLYEAIRRAALDLQSRPRPRAIVLLTDGKDDVREWHGSEPPASQAEAASSAAAADAPVYLLGFGRTDDVAMMDVAERTNGRFLKGPSADQIDRLFADVGAFLNPYVIRFTRERPANAERVRLRVEVAADGARGWDEDKLTVERQPTGAPPSPTDEPDAPQESRMELIPIVLIAIIVVCGALLFLQRSRPKRDSRITTPRPRHPDGGVRTRPSVEPVEPARSDERTKLALDDNEPSSRSASRREVVTVVRTEEDAGPKVLAWLTILEGADHGTRQILAPDCQIGRSTDPKMANDVIIDDPTVSRVQARLRLLDGQWILYDLSDKQPVLVNGERGHGKALHSDDEIRFGDTILRFHLPRSSPA